MRQWELFGITDSDPAWTPSSPRRGSDPLRDVDRFPAVFWSTDGALRLTSVSEAGLRHLGVPSWEGLDLLDVLGLDPVTLPILDAHVCALGGATATFRLRCDGRSIHCRVSPTTDIDDEVIGTFCIAVDETIDLLDVSADRVRVA